MNKMKSPDWGFFVGGCVKKKPSLSLFYTGENIFQNKFVFKSTWKCGSSGIYFVSNYFKRVFTFINLEYIWNISNNVEYFKINLLSI